MHRSLLVLVVFLVAGAGCVVHGVAPAPRPVPAPPEVVVRPVESPEDALWKPAVEDRAWETIIVHHAAFEEGSAASIDELHKRKGWDGLGYHFVIGNGSLSGDGQVEIGWRWKSQREGAHCRVDDSDDNRFNLTGVGICLVGDFTHHPPSDRQLASLHRLTRWLQGRYRIPADQVRRHGDVKTTECPGDLFPWASFQERLTRKP